MDDLISRQAAIEVIDAVFPVDPMKSEYAQGIACGAALAKTYVEQLPSAQPDLSKYSDKLWRNAYERGKRDAQPERKWTSCSNPPKHHKDVIVRGIEAIGNVTVHKVMQWDVDTWRPTDYAPSVMWKEWSEI